MPLAAVALVVSTLLHAGTPALSLSTPALSSAVPTLMYSSAAPTDSEYAVFDPTETRGPESNSDGRWVAPHMETSLWSTSGSAAADLGVAHQWAPLQLVGEPKHDRLPVWDPATRMHAWVDARAVGPVDPSLIGTGLLPPIGRPVAWGGPARITMYTCVELGGCAPTAAGPWPEPGMVAVDPAVIPLGSTVWVQGLGTFLATDTGSLVRGAHLDVFCLSYQDALNWGVQERSVLVFPPQ
jgi:3D (Asp-Asp-Asp) domain-containing protein